MSKKQFSIFAFVPLSIVFTNILIIDFIRPIWGKKKFGIISFCLGCLPNFLAALSFMLLAVLTFMFLSHKSPKIMSPFSIHSINLFCCILTLISLVWHEVNQRKPHSNLHYDTNDIFATIFGVILGYSIFRLFELKGYIKIAHK